MSCLAPVGSTRIDALVRSAKIPRAGGTFLGYPPNYGPRFVCGAIDEDRRQERVTRGILGLHSKSCCSFKNLT